MRHGHRAFRFTRIESGCGALIFNAAALNTQRWQLNQFQNAKLRQAGERLNFLVRASTPDEDYAFVELLNNQPGYNENWQLLLDVSYGENRVVASGAANMDDFMLGALK